MIKREASSPGDGEKRRVQVQGQLEKRSEPFQFNQPIGLSLWSALAHGQATAGWKNLPANVHGLDPHCGAMGLRHLGQALVA